MPVDVLKARVASGGGEIPVARWLGLVTLLLVEGLLLGIRFDTASIQGLEGAWWMGPLQRISAVLPIAIAVGTAALLFGSARLRAALAPLTSALARPRPIWPYLVGHGAALVTLAWVTAEVLERGRLTTSGTPGLWAVAWITAGLLTLGFWLLLVLPPRSLLALVPAAAPALGAAVVVGLVAYAAGDATSHLWYPLRDWTFAVVQAAIRFFPDPVFEPADFVVGTERFSVHISPQCSGYEGIGLTSVFLGAYLLIFRRTLRFPQALLLLPIGLVAVWLGNALRIVALVAIGTWVSPDIAIGGFHSYAGSLLFCGIALALTTVANRAPFFSTVAGRPEVGPNLTAAYVGPFVTMVAVSMLTGALSADGFDRLYPLRIIAVLVVLWRCRRSYTVWRWTWSWTAAGIGAGIFVLWIALARTADQGAGNAVAAAGFATLPPLAAAVWLAFRLVGALVIVPIVEELTFRGYVMRRVAHADFASLRLDHAPLAGILVSSLLFGLLHERVVAGTLAGLAYALAARRRGELADAVVAHATTNALLALYVMTTGDWGAWG